MHRSRRAAFTLIELSIVIVIIGILAGGVVAGQSLIRASQLRAILAERNSFLDALDTFEDKYLAMAGDMPNAFAFWGASCGTNTTDAGTGCNGDGDGNVSDFHGETGKLWEHLARASLIAGAYDGTGTVSSDRLFISKANVPSSKFTGASWLIANCVPMQIAGSNVPMGDCLMFGSVDPTTPGSNDALVESTELTLGEAYNLDKKIDDGQANAGKMRGRSSTSCSDAGTDFYNISTAGEDTKGQCSITFPVE